MFRSRLNRNSLIIALGLALLVGCNGSPDRITVDTSENSVCTYDEAPGTATIESVEAASENDTNCVDAVVVLFSFVNSAGETDANLLYQLNVGDGLNPNATWAEGKGLVKGATFSLTLKELVEGSGCPALTYEFADLDLTDYEDSCF